MTGSVEPALRIGWRREVIPAHLRRRIVAAVLAAAAVILVMTSVTTSRAGVPVAVAAHDLPAGARLAARDIALIELPAKAAPSGVAHSSQPLLGQVLVGPVRAREPLTDARLEGRTAATAELGPGEVAAPVRVVDPSLGGLLHPGATVDVLAAAGTPTGAADADQTAARTVARGARVVAVPTMTDGSAPAAGGAGTLVVLAVTREEAQVLAGAEASGRLSVVFDDG